MVTTDVIKTKPSNGYNLFNEEQQALHDAYVKTGESEFLWKLQDLCNKPKLQDLFNNQKSTKMPVTKIEQQSILDNRLIDIAYGASLLNDEQRVVYYAWIVEATDPVTSNTRRNDCNRSATSMADCAAKKQAEIDKRAAMTTDELKIYNNSK